MTFFWEVKVFFDYKKYLLSVIVAIFGLSTHIEASCQKYQKNLYYYAGLYKGGVACYEYHVDAKKIPVFTLKQRDYSSADFDIYIFDYSDLSGKLKSGTESGSETELVTLPYQNSSNYVYVVIKNAGSGVGYFNLYIHEIDISQKIANTLVQSTVQSGVELILEGLFDVNANYSNSEQRNISRGSTAIMAYLNNKNLNDTSKELMINELTTGVQEKFGYGFSGKLLVNFGVDMIRDIYRFY